MRAEIATDMSEVSAVINHPSVWPHMVSDGGPERFVPVASGARAFFVRIMEGETLYGIFVVDPQTSVCWNVHACLLPVCRGADAIKAYETGLEFLKKETNCMKVIGQTPEYNRAALFVAYRVGFKKIGTNEKSILKDGKLWDQIIVGKVL